MAVFELLMLLYIRCFAMICVSAVEPVVFDTGLIIVCGQWCHNGSVLAISGQQAGAKDNSYVCFYAPFGNVCTLQFCSMYCHRMPQLKYK